MQIPNLQYLADLSRQTPSKDAVVLRRPRVLMFLLPLWWLLIVIGLARPVWVADPIEKTESTRDLMLLVDLSGSMETEDFKDPQGKRISRLDAVKMVLGDFIESRKSDRLGLIVFGNEPFLQVPFTRDHEVVRSLLGETKAKMAGAQTAIGDAIGLAVKHFESSKSEHRVVGLLEEQEALKAFLSSQSEELGPTGSQKKWSGERFYRPVADARKAQIQKSKGLKQRVEQIISLNPHDVVDLRTRAGS